MLACRSLHAFLPRGSGDAEGTREARARAAGASYPMMLVSVKRLVRTSRPRITPPAGVHEGSVVVSFDCPPGVLVFLRIPLETTTPLHLLHPACCVCVCARPACCVYLCVHPVHFVSVCALRAYMHQNAPAHVHTHACVRVHAHARTHTRTETQTQTHRHTHTHTHTHTCARAEARKETSCLERKGFMVYGLWFMLWPLALSL